MQSLQEFVNYVWDFYKPHSDLYPIKGLVKQDIWDALVTYRKRIDSKNVYYNHYSWGEVDRISPEAPIPVLKLSKENKVDWCYVR